MRTFTRDERAEMESERRRISLSQTPEVWADKDLRDKAEMTARFLATSEAKPDGGRDPAHTGPVSDGGASHQRASVGGTGQCDSGGI